MHIHLHFVSKPLKQCVCSLVIRADLANLYLRKPIFSVIAFCDLSLELPGDLLLAHERKVPVMSTRASSNDAHL